MSYRVREARHDDVDSISEWTRDTFSWGDYVPERMPLWLDQDESCVLVAVGDDDVPVALAHTTLLSPGEAWMEAARVHPDHRRQGIGKALNDAGVEWAREGGARVVRLATDEDNEPAVRQVEGLGYRVVSEWVFSDLQVDPMHRASDQFRLRPAPSSDADAAWLFWAASDLARGGRELIALRWQWRTARPEDVTGVGDLYQSAAGWVSVEQPEPDWMNVLWMATTAEDLLPLLDGLLDLAAQREVSEVTVKLPNLGWTSEGLRRAGGDVGTVLIQAKGL